MFIRPFTDADRARLIAITDICFAGVSIDYAIETKYGVIAGKDWRWRKAQQIADDIAANAEGIFVAVEDGDVVIGYVTSRVDHATKIGWIPNLAVLPAYRQRGLGKALIETALAYMEAQGMCYARIETLAHNVVGQHVYPSFGFAEVARQIHYMMPLGEEVGGKRQDAGCKMQEAGCKMQEAGCKRQDAGCKMQDARGRKQGARVKDDGSTELSFSR